MGAEQSTLAKNGYVVQTETEKSVVAKKEEETFLIKKIDLQKNPTVLPEKINILKTTSHPHIVNYKNSFQDQNIDYIVMDHCQGGSLAAKIRDMTAPPQESEILSWIVEICVALKAIHEKGLHHKHLTPESIFLTEFGLVCLGGFEKSDGSVEILKYKAPEVFTSRTYNSKCDIWSVGCILYKLCARKQAFTAEAIEELIGKIIGGPYPSLPDRFSSELHQLLGDIFSRDPQTRPTASEILARPFIIRCLLQKSKTTMDELQENLNKLRTLADGLERVHQGTTIGSLTGGVIGAAGGVTSIVGLILAPFTLGASLIVTGVGVGVSVLGGVTAGASNITNMVNQSSDRKAVRHILKEFEKKTEAVATWLQEISNSLQVIENRCNSYDTADTNDSTARGEDLLRIGMRASRGMGGIAELVRLLQVMNIGKIAAQATRAVRVAETVTGVLSGLFIAVDIFFIAMDAKELHHIRQAKAAEEGARPPPESVFGTETNNSVSTCDRKALLPSSMMQVSKLDTSKTQVKPSPDAIKSEIMKFAQSIRQAADTLQGVLNELQNFISSIPQIWFEGEPGWQNMELM